MAETHKTSKSNEDLKDLLHQVSVMRRDGPCLIKKWMEKEKKGLQENLKSAKYDVPNRNDENLKIHDKKYFLDAMEESKLKNPSNICERQMELNSQTEALRRALEILKKK